MTFSNLKRPAMASLLQRLLRRQYPAVLTALCRQNSGYQNLSSALLTHRSQSIDSRLNSLFPPKPLKDDDSTKPEVKFDYVYPSFSFGLVVNPVFQKIVTEEREVDEDGSGKMWADSTKKKRKKKMNKHKYKKLRKRMRNK